MNINKIPHSAKRSGTGSARGEYIRPLQFRIIPAGATYSPPTDFDIAYQIISGEFHKKRVKKSPKRTIVKEHLLMIKLQWQKM